MTAAAQNATIVTANVPNNSTDAAKTDAHTTVPDSTDSIDTTFQHEQEIRGACIEGRRLICGKILDVLPEGLVVDSGYTNLLREPLTKSWLAPGTVAASRPANLMEGKTPGAFCVGLTLVTNPPTGKKLKPAKYDYVIIEGYPAGQCVYTSAGGVRRTVRRFSANLAEAVRMNLETEDKSASSSPQVK